MFPNTVSLYLLNFCRIAIGLVFVVSSVSKVLDLVQFRQTIRNFHILPEWLSGIATLLFLCSEFAVVALVIIGGPLLTLGFSLAIFLLLLYCIVLVSTLVRRIRTSCNCFGTSVTQVSQTDVWRNVGLLLCALSGYGTIAWTRDAQWNLSLLDSMFTGLGAIAFVVLWTHLGEIVQLFRQG